MSKTSFMTEAEIQAYERHEAVDYAAGSNEFERLLRSYRLAASVANAAWSVREMIANKSPDAALESGRRLGALDQALHEYAPKYFPRVEPMTVLTLQKLFDVAAELPRGEVSQRFLDWLFDCIVKLQEKAP